MMGPTVDSTIELPVGVHEWSDAYGNHGTEVIGQHQIETQTLFSQSLFNLNSRKMAFGLASYLNRQGDPRRKLMVAVDTCLTEGRKSQIQCYLERCKTETLLQDYKIVSIATCETEKTFDQVSKLIEVASRSKLKRRDLFVAVGGATVVDLVSFTAAIYRRSTPWILVPTGPMDIIQYSNRSSLHHVHHKGTFHKALLALNHPPLAVFLSMSFSDLNFERFHTVHNEDFHEANLIKTRYHVALTPKLFHTSNETLIRGYCSSTTSDYKRKILVVVDTYPGNISVEINRYFSRHSLLIDKHQIFRMQVASGHKGINEVQRVIDAAIDLGICQKDLFVVVGGGTLMDIVGFAAHMYCGGTPYLRIPTTLVGIIDAGVGVKVGVNFGSYKNLIGGYYAPVACLNDPETFLVQLSRREFACGLAESMKMALLKSDRLFEVIEKHHRTLAYNAYTHELVEISVRTMLEELQPNLHEHDLRRLVDFGHEFGHIVEGLAKYELPHGECVAIGIAISSSLACANGILSRKELDRILKCTLDLGLPIHAMSHSCCDPEALWQKISTEGIDHKDGMLWLAIPEAIGHGRFLDHITDISAEMVKETLLALEQYAGQYARANASTKQPSTDAGTSCERSSHSQSTTSSTYNAREIISKAVTEASISSDSEAPENQYSLLSSWPKPLEEIGAEALSEKIEFCEMQENDLANDVTTSGRENISRVDTTPTEIFTSSDTQTSARAQVEELPQLLDQSEPRSQSAIPLSHSLHSFHAIVIDVGATYFRIGIANPEGSLIAEPDRVPSPSKHTHPEDTLAQLQERLIEAIAHKIDTVRAECHDLLLVEVGVSFGAVITNEGIVDDASILWNESARGYDLRSALQQRLPGLCLTVLNDVSAAAWRYKDEGRFCLITVSSGLSNKVFNSDLQSLNRLDLDAAGVGGEMGHVLAEPRAVDGLILDVIEEALAKPDEFKCSQLSAYVHGNAQKINARHIGLAAQQGDQFTSRLIEHSDVPWCPCGNLADLCSYSSGRAALRYARKLAARSSYDVHPSDINDNWLQQMIEAGHPLALKVLHSSTYQLSLRILQLAADIGLDKFIIVGGFALKTGRKAYLLSIQDHLVRFCHYSAFFANWNEDKVRNLVKFGVDDDNDGLIGMSHFLHHQRMYFPAIEKPIGEQALETVLRKIPRCGTQEILTKVIFAGICTTDLQILRGERGHEPIVMGHEGVCQVLEVGGQVSGVQAGNIIVLNPNNPLDDHDKLGHTKEGVFQLYMKFGRESLLREQVLNLGNSVPSVTDTLIEPLSCVIAAQERIKDRILGKNVLIVGAGLMGLMFATMNNKMGARNVFLANRSIEKLEFAVSRGIVQKDKIFISGSDISSKVKRATDNEGIDIAVISVSLGQGVSAAQDAMDYINSDGCVYLFAGFRPGDIIHADDGAVEAWPIRTDWRTETVKVAGKPVHLSGHRGSRKEDLAKAAEIIRGDSLSFDRIISHIISLDAIPQVLLGLARSGSVKGAQAKRVVVDMAASGSLIESPEEFSLRQLREAARKKKSAISMGNLFREIGFDGEKSMLGWVYPPAWQDIRNAILRTIKMKPFTSKRHFVFVGTGSWGFLVNALKELSPSCKNVQLHVLQSLHPTALSNLFSVLGSLAEVVCLGITQSGTTLETVMLMDTLRERFDAFGLDYQNHFLWLTDTCIHETDTQCGEAVIRSSTTHDWRNVDVVPLTIGNHRDINALFCAPHSMMFFLSLFLLLDKDLLTLHNMHCCYLEYKDEMAHAVLSEALTVALHSTEVIEMHVDESITPAVTGLVTQLVEQALGSKQLGFNPRVNVGSGDNADMLKSAAFPVPKEASRIVKMMLTMYSVSVFVAVVAHHRRIAFVTHPKVNDYKRRALQLWNSDGVRENKLESLEEAGGDVIRLINNSPQLQFVDVLCYNHLSPALEWAVKTWLVSLLPSARQSILITVSQGETWNHSRYQAAAQNDNVAVVILTIQSAGVGTQIDGVSSVTLEKNVKMLDAISRATYETLSSKAVYFRIKDHGFQSSQLQSQTNRTQG